MSRKRSRRKGMRAQWSAIGAVIALVAVVILLKAWRQGSRAAGPALSALAPSAANGEQAPALSTAAVVGTTASGPSLAAATPLVRTASSPEAQLDRLLAEGQPVLAFFHSMTCTPCIQMDEIVKEVYPEYQDKVGLVDVNVYDKGNQNLLRRANLRVIPTLILIGRNGEARGYTGVMPADALREQLEALAEGG
jgi:thiol:disulfide interchange protein